jgi:glyoxylase-like metal-dependent hydrolase (beta-lactamase superfamily II)
VRIVRVLAPNPDVRTLEGTNTWVVGSDPAIVIDPGPDDARHLREVHREAGRVSAILLTHRHPDHAPGARPLAELTGAPVFSWRAVEGGQTLRDGETIRADGVALTVVHTPGHTPDHVCFALDGGEVLFTGDAVLGRGTSVIDPPEGDLVAYLRSLHRMRELEPQTIYPGHGPVVLDGVAKLEEYLAHREEREQQVVTRLKEAGDEGSVIGDLVTSIYASYPEDVLPLARRSILAHLQKLEAESRVDHTGSGDSARYALHTPRSCDRCGRRVRGRMRLCDRCQLAVLQERPGVDVASEHDTTSDSEPSEPR